MPNQHNSQDFWSLVSKQSTSCWLWTGRLSKQGYGNINRTYKGKRIYLAHRMSWALSHNEYPSQFVLHRCDIPACVNPEHLFIGTQKENMRDCVNKGRFHANVGKTMESKPERRARGERQHSAKLTTRDVQEIRRLANQGFRLKDIIPMFPVGKSAIRAIITGKTWAHVEPLAPKFVG